MNPPTELRRQLRAARRAIPPWQQEAASQAVCDSLLRLPQYRKANRIAAYLGVQGEIDPLSFLYQAHAANKQCFLPVLHPFREGSLWFARWTPESPMRINRYGISEPDPNQGGSCAARYLDLVIVPLLGFDAQCNRLGMGGGYYDRTFSFRHRRKSWIGPTLVGIAHQQQRLDHVPTQSWDVQLDKVITPEQSF